MPVLALWSAPRARSTAFWRSMLQRGDLLALHEPFCNLTCFGETDVDGRTFRDPTRLLGWLRGKEAADGPTVFFKDTTDYRQLEVLADRPFLAGARHAFLIRRPEEIAASYYERHPRMTINAIGLKALHELHGAVADAGGHQPVVIDSDDLVARPAATMAAYCAAVGLPFLPGALRWEPGPRSEWARSARWHEEAGASSGFRDQPRAHEHTVDNTEQLRRFAAYHRPFYEELYAQRLVID